MDSSILNGIVSSAQTIFDKASQLPIYAHIAIVLLGLPILAISINVAWQIVSSPGVKILLQGFLTL
jgi:hypothetical protein